MSVRNINVWVMDPQLFKDNFIWTILVCADYLRPNFNLWWKSISRVLFVLGIIYASDFFYKIPVFYPMRLLFWNNPTGSIWFWFRYFALHKRCISFTYKNIFIHLKYHFILPPTIAPATLWYLLWRVFVAVVFVAICQWRVGVVDLVFMFLVYKIFCFFLHCCCAVTVDFSFFLH